MTLLYKKIQRVNPLKKDEPRKWYPVVKSLGTLSEKEVAKRISDETTLNPKEAEMALAQLEKVLISGLLDGYTVKIGDWGVFQVTVNSMGSEEEKDANASKITKVNIRFTAGTSLREAAQKATFRSAADLAGGKNGSGSSGEVENIGGEENSGS